ncbi:MAG TPA: cardiolipin synthase ClsB [Rhodocyclaceae bacterium]|nr:cardiolipin synthase ClsB [Rhodocyclaceae bacterium]
MKPNFLAGNRITLLETGADYFPALIAAIGAAQTEIHLESYIYAGDGTGQAVTTALVQAARRGVDVHVMVDGFGAPDFLASFGYTLIAGGVQVMIYRPEVARLRLRRHRLRRLHRKLAVVDARLAFVGGINIVDDIDTPGVTKPRFDYAVAIEGPLLEPIHRASHHLWRLVRWANFRRRLPYPPLVDGASEPIGELEAAFVVRDNLRHRRDIEEAYLDAIEGAREEVVIANAYFLPGRRFRHALMDAAARGVRVSVLLQGRIEYVLQYFATQALYGSLIAGGISIFEYRASFLHAKVAVIDGQWATVGSSNIDPFSLLLAREANVIVRNRGFAAGLRESLGRAMREGAVEIRADDLRKRSWLARTASWLAYATVRLAVGIAGYHGPEYRG